MPVLEAQYIARLTMMMVDDIDIWSDGSSDESWTPSIDDDEELSDDEGVDWWETPPVREACMLRLTKLIAR
jgi:hypothetical protein